MLWQHDNLSVEKANVAVGQQKQNVVVVATKRICRRCKRLAEKSCVVVSIKMASDSPRGDNVLKSSRALSPPGWSAPRGCLLLRSSSFSLLVTSDLFQRCAHNTSGICWPSLLGILKGCSCDHVSACHTYHTRHNTRHNLDTKLDTMIFSTTMHAGFRK